MCNVFLAGFDGTIAASTYATIGSSFGAAHLASWITTSYQLTSTAAQPLYGRFSDIFGRKICLLLATAMFGLGCLGSSVSNDMLMLCLTRALTGIGGGGLITMSTIINSDLVPPKQRGMYQAVQNIMMGFGMTSGACLGGSIADSVGWRFGFLLQVPIAAGGFAVACTMVHNINYQSQAEPSKQSQWKQVDFAGSFTLVSGLTLLTAALSLGSMDLSLRSPSTLVCFIGSVIFLFAFVRVEASTSAKAIMPLFMFQRLDRAILLVSNIGLGFTVNGLLFLMPLVFQTVLLDSPSTAGFRLLPPSMMAPIGGIATGYIMTRGDYLLSLSRLGQILFLFSVTLLLTLDFDAEGWKYSASMLPSSFGQGAMYPAGLFAFIRTVEKPEHAVATGTVYLTRSVGGICGIAAVSTVTQTILVSKLNIALRGLSNGNEVSLDI